MGACTMLVLCLFVGAHAYVCPTSYSRIATSAVRTKVPACVRMATMQQPGQEQLEVTKEALPGSAFAVELKIPASATKEAWDTTISKLTSQTKVPGFRAGKAPSAQVVSHIGKDRLKQKVIESLYGQYLEQALQQVEIQPIGEPTMNCDLDEITDKWNPGEAFTINMKVDAWPEVSIDPDSYQNLKFVAERPPFDQVAYDKSLEELRSRAVDVEPIDDEGYQSQIGDQLKVNMEGFQKMPDGSKGPPLPVSAAGSGVDVPLLPGRFMPGFTEGLVGMEKGQTRVIPVTMPARSRVAELSGAECLFEVECLEVLKRTMPEVNDEFASKILPGSTWEELDAKIREGVDQEQEKFITENVNRAIEEKLIERATEFDVPETLILEQTKKKFATMLAEMRDQGMSDEKIKESISEEGFKKFREVSEKNTIRSLKASLLENIIAKQQGIEVTPADIEEELNVMEMQAGGADKFDREYARTTVSSDLERKRTLEWLRERSDIEFEVVELKLPGQEKPERASAEM